MKRKRTDKVALPVPELPADSASGSDPEPSQHEAEVPLDSFAEELAQPIEALHEAVTDATAFLQPSEQLSTLARTAARVSCTLSPLFFVSALRNMRSGTTGLLSNAVQDWHAHSCSHATLTVSTNDNLTITLSSQYLLEFRSAKVTVCCVWSH